MNDEEHKEFYLWAGKYLAEYGYGPSAFESYLFGRSGDWLPKLNPASLSNIEDEEAKDPLGRRYGTVMGMRVVFDD